jgi:hypothetical protein
VVVEVANPDPYGSEADLGLVPGGRVKLVKSTSIDVTSQPTRRGPERYNHIHMYMYMHMRTTRPHNRQRTTYTYIVCETLNFMLFLSG